MSPTTDTAIPPNNRRLLVEAGQALLLSILLVALLHGDALYNWWCGDDPQILLHARRYSPLEYFCVPEAWRALIPYSLTPWLTLAYDFDYALFGLMPAGFHLHSLLTTALCACLAYLIARQWVDRWYASGGMLLFLVGVPVVVTVRQLPMRHYLEGLLFFLLALLLCIRGIQEQRRSLGWLAGVAFAVAATAKELYLPLGFIVVLLPLGSFRQRLQAAWPLLLVMLLYVPWRWYMLGDVVGGYTPVGELGQGDLGAALAQFVKAPGLLLLAPWAGLSGVTLAVGLLLFRGGKSRWGLVLLAALPALLLTPLVPLARMPGITAGSERYFVAVWGAFALGTAIVLGRSALGRRLPIRLFMLAVLAALVVSAGGKARQTLADLNPALQEQYVQGHALVTAGSQDIIYLTPAMASWYVSGLLELYRSPASSPLPAVDELDLQGVAPAGRRILRYDHAGRTMQDISQQVPEILAVWQKKVKPVPLSVAMEYDSAAKALRWQLGPYDKGVYTLLAGPGRQPLPPQGALRMDKPPADRFRFRYDAPEGWIAYTPSLHLAPAGDRRYGVSWRGVEAIGASSAAVKTP